METLTLEERIERFLCIGSGYGSGYGYGYGDGYGYGSGSGYGYGDGYGSGYGDGDGSGYGDGDGSGYGDGDGDGDGSGYGDGSGDGDGDGDGSGYGYGYGDGSGDGIKSFEGNRVHYIDGVPTCITHVSGTRYAIGFTFQCFVKKTCYIARVENFFAHGETLREAFNDAHQKAMQTKPIEERIKYVVKQHPDPTAAISNQELFNLHNTLTGSCEFGRRQFCERHSISLEDSMSISDFIMLTKDEYCGNSIKLLAEAYGINCL